MLAELLRTIQSAPDTARLFAALGYHRELERRAGGAWLVAKWRGYEVVACPSPNPRAEARALAARMSGASRRALAVAVGAGELVIAAPRLDHGGSTHVLAV